MHKEFDVAGRLGLMEQSGGFDFVRGSWCSRIVDQNGQDMNAVMPMVFKKTRN